MNVKQKICGLITDFGNEDYFIGVMKGVMKQITPEIEIIDISNQIPSYNIFPASFTIEKSYTYFPESTIFLVVVDPGVGTNRKILLVEHENRFFIGPDNGVLTPILQKKQKTVSILNNKKYFLIDGNSTFEARDKMAPAAAYLAGGIEPHEMATITSEYVVTPNFFPTLNNGNITASIVYIDKFGNIITNLTKEFIFDTLKTGEYTDFKTILNSKEINNIYGTYENAGTEAEPFMVIGSHGNLEIAMNMQSAASFLNASVGQEMQIQLF